MTTVDDDPRWYENAVIYQLHVRAFCDSNGDGIGDFPGLASKLDYLQELGVTALWLLPFYPSPLRDDGYDIANYTDVHPHYGTLRDFRLFIREAHQRGLRVITELVLNHTSDQHPWFQRARRARPGTSARDFYVWSDTATRYADARIIFKDFETSNWTWDPFARAYYWHRFYSHQPDLNFDHPPVHRALLKAVDFWFRLGVDGLRLDAVPYLYEREGTTCENLPETHNFLKKLRQHVDERFPGRMLLAEANQWPEDAIAYFGEGDECHMAFHFPLMPRLFMSVRMEDRFPIIDILQQTPEVPEGCQWAVFLRNHDELTLEMVTDEERDYMYRVYAHDRQARINLGIRRRLAPLLSNNRRKVELMNGLLFSLPGTPVIYYGDEISMGDNVYLGDRNGVRTPMQWSADRNAGFSSANGQKLYLPVIIDPEYHYQTINVEAQQNNPSSMLWWIRRLISLRQRHPVFGRGSIEFLHPDNPKVLTFLRRSDDEDVLVVANLSRFVQSVEVDLSAFRERTPVELFSLNRFPSVGERPYFLTLGPHSFYWFALERQADHDTDDSPGMLQTLTVGENWQSIFRSRSKRLLEAALKTSLPRRRWFGSKAQTLDSISIIDVLAFPPDTEDSAAILLVEARYADAESEMYQLPVTCLMGREAEALLRETPHAAFALVKLRNRDEAGVLCDAAHDPSFCAALLAAIRRNRRTKTSRGEVMARRLPRLKTLLARVEDDGDLLSSVSRAEQSNTSITYGRALILKLFRRVADGVNPDLEVAQHLTEVGRFEHVPAVAGSVEYRTGRDEQRTLAVLQEWIANEGDAWKYTLSVLSDYLERSLTDTAAEPPVPERGVLDIALHEPDGDGSSVSDASADALSAGADADAPNACDPPAKVQELAGHYLQSIELIGQRTAELHLSLASSDDHPDFAPESFTPHHYRSVYQSIRSQCRQALRTLRKRIDRLEQPQREAASVLLETEQELLEQFRPILEGALSGKRIRTHGDYHLGQILFTGRDFIIIDFEGEPARPLSERRLKRSPLRDVAGMLRSFDYAAATAWRNHEQRLGLSTDAEHTRLKEWAEVWRHWVSATFLRSYLRTMDDSPLIPQRRNHLEAMLRGFVIEKAAYELEYELNSRPDWVEIPLHSLLRLMGYEAAP